MQPQTPNSQKHSRKRTLARESGKVAVTSFELFVLAEILWYYLHNGEQTLHEAIAEWWGHCKDSLAQRAEIAHTRAMIRSLRETR